MPHFPLALAVTASAAFPIGLPPVRLKRKLFDAATTFEGQTGFSKGLSLTDGGVLENLGIQTLLKSYRFAAHHLIVSDAGTQDDDWSPKWYGSMKSLGLGFLGGSILDRVMLTMNSKQNRWARQQVIEEVHLSWLLDAASRSHSSRAVNALINRKKSTARRNTIFARINTNWAKFIGSVPDHQFIELNRGKETITIPSSGETSQREKLLNGLGVNLGVAREYYEKLGGDKGAKATNEVATSFSGLSSNTLSQLENHAAWQVHAANAIYKFA